MAHIAGQTRDPDRVINCPKCAGAMGHVPFGGWTVDRCANCHGLWFDAREQEQLKDVEGSEAIDIGTPAAGSTPPVVGKVKCPVCNTQMIQMVDRRQPHLKFESCTVCYGAFFDAGEFRDYKEVTLVESVRGLFGRRG